MNNKTRYKFVMIICIQIAIIIFFACKRENLYWDEYYSFEEINYYYDDIPWHEGHYIMYDYDFNYNEWLDSTWIYNTLTVELPDSAWGKSWMYVLKKPFLITPYFALLSVIYSIFALGQLSIWPAVIVNIIFFIFTQCILYKLTLRLTKTDKMALMAVFMYGFAGLTISMGIFVRAYMWVAFGMISVLYIHYMHWSEKRLWKLLFEEILALFLAYEMSLDAPFALVWFGIVFLIYGLYLYKDKQYRKIWFYTIPIGLCGCIYVAFFTKYLYSLIHIKEVLAEGGASAISAIFLYVYTMRPIDIFVRTRDMVVTTTNRMFGSWIVFLFGMIVLFVCCTKSLGKSKGDKNYILDKEGMTTNTSECRFVKIILYSSLASVAFSTVACLYITTRYISYFFPQFALSIVIVCMYLCKNVQTIKNVLCTITIIGLIVTCVVPQVDFLYIGDKKAISNVRAIECDSYMSYYANGMHDPHVTYELIYIAGPGKELYVCNGQEEIIDGLRDTMIISVIDEQKDVESLESYLKDNGYNYELIDSTYKHNYYLATRI